jgi:hypothetical protein
MKKQLKNQKNRQIRRKITKSSMTFNDNKPNLSEDKYGVSSFETNKYEILPARRSKNQTQFKPNLNQNKANTNPIRFYDLIALSSFMTSKYVKFEDSTD